MITLSFSCDRCGTDAKVSVRDRWTNEGIDHWFQDVVEQVNDAHEMLCPISTLARGGQHQLRVFIPGGVKTAALIEVIEASL